MMRKETLTPNYIKTLTLDNCQAVYKFMLQILNRIEGYETGGC